MTDGAPHPGKLGHLFGLAAILVLTGVCYLIWQQSSGFVELFGVPELRIVAAMAGAFVLLSLAEFVISRLR
jgi:hypothetical protein